MTNREPGVKPGDQKNNPEGAQEPEPPALPSARLWLVDGYNALHTRVFRAEPEEDEVGREAGAEAGGETRDDVSSWWRGSMRERLVTLAGGFPDPDAEIWIVFDGPRPADRTQRADRPCIHVEFAPSADEWIVKRVRSAPDPTRIAVVTRDRKVADRCRHRGAQVVWPLAFLEQCGTEPSAASDEASDGDGVV